MNYTSARSTLRPRRFRSVAVLAATIGLIAVSPAQGAATSHPAGGSEFSVDAQGWTGAGGSCSVGITLLCSASTPYVGSVGIPPGRSPRG
jgi:hypothetical protein